MPLINWINGDGKTWGLSVHPVGKSKDGASLVPSFNLDGARKDSAVKTMHAIGIDIDSGTSLDDVIDRLEDANIFATVYTTFNHRTTKMVLKHDEVMRKLKIQSSPDLVQVQEYLATYHDTQFDQTFIEQIEVVEARTQTKDGMRIILKVPPIDKFRVVIPLAEPVELSDLAPTLAQWKEVWADAVTGLCKHILKCEFDTTSTDVNRLFYSPRHAKGAEFYSAVVMGKPLKFEDIKPYSKAKFLAERKNGDNPFLVGEIGTQGDYERFTTASGRDLNKWHTAHKRRFLIADVLETYCSDKEQDGSGGKAGTLTVDCPFDHEHSSTDGTGIYAQNPDVCDSGYWSVKCHHDSCKGRPKVQFLAQMIEDEWFDESVLDDETFYLPSDDGIDDQPVSALNLKTIADVKTALQQLGQSPEQVALDAFIGRITGPVDAVPLQELTKGLKKATGLPIGSIRGMLKHLKHVRSVSDGKPIFDLEDDYTELCDTLHDTIIDQGDDPKLFQNGGRLVDIRANEHDTLTIAAVNPPRFKGLVERRARFSNNGSTQGVPDNMANNVFQRDLTHYPPLFRIASAPTYGGDGSLLTSAGYHPSSGMYYQPKTGVTIPHVPAIPTVEQVDQAVDDLLDLFADFPLDALSRQELFQKLEDGKDLPSFCHLLSLGLTPILREMIAGPTPNHLARKDKPRTGATAIVTNMAQIATLAHVIPASLPNKPEEVQKTIVAMLDTGAQLMFFDNLPVTAIDSGELAGMVTAYPFYQGRRLGVSEMITVANKAVLVTTGNRTAMSEELAQRTVMIDLDPQMETPGDRPTSLFKYELDTHVPANAARYLHAMLIICQNWIAQGRPMWTGKPLAGFESYSKTIGGVLEAAGVYGFLSNHEKLQDKVQTVNPETELQDAMIELHHQKKTLFRVSSDARPPETVEGKPFKYAGFRAVSIMSVLDAHEIAIKGWDYLVQDGVVTYPLKAKSVIAQKIRGMVGSVREWGEAQTEEVAKQKRYILTKVHSDKVSALYMLEEKPLVGVEKAA
ncbi:hypothetical protein A8B74_01660 [Sulfitobacter geojensis]|nr:hypothetical protein A8B74_01660 [Sulfitobacter geojensis]